MLCREIPCRVAESVRALLAHGLFSCFGPTMRRVMARVGWIGFSGLLFVNFGVGCATQSVNEEPLALAESSLSMSWQPTASMSGRRYHTATVLQSGKVFVVGGWNREYLATAIIYAPATGTWSSADALAMPRQGHAAVMLPSGKVLVVGGENSNGYTTAAELYDPATGTWSSAGATSLLRGYNTATVLPSGKVLVAGGLNWGGAQRTVDTYDPAMGAWSIAAPLIEHRHSHTATVLPSGKVLVAGGWGGGASATAEEYNPETGTWSSAGVMETARYDHTATLLPSGKVLVVGGQNANGAVGSAEIYDPATGTWSPAGTLAAARYKHTATLVAGKVLVAGGQASGVLSGVEVYNPATGSWSATDSMLGPRTNHTAALLESIGKVLVMGGEAGSLLETAEVYDTCTLITCDTPPSQCYSAPGTCSNGTCSYSPAVPSADGGVSCESGSTTSCATSCGSTGTKVCSASCTWSACTPPASEACNGADDDCDGQVDEGFECSGSGSRSCTAWCGQSGTQACNPSMCTYGACVSSSCCETNGDCQSGYYCSGTTCVAKKANGVSCSSASQCASGQCVDGVCCDADCGGGGGGGSNDCPGNLVTYRGQNGAQVSCYCAGFMTGDGAVWGTGTYTDDSALCRAAVHAGAVTTSGGFIMATIKPGLSSYSGSTRNGVTTLSYGAWAGSYTIVSLCPSDLVAYRGQNGRVITCGCPSTATGIGSLWGTNIYTDDSTLCRAAVHAGRITTSGGSIRAVISAGRSSYTGSTRNGVTSSSWGSWGGSYYFQ